jgi:putative glycosyltransferase (TIGR04348 family)
MDIVIVAPVAGDSLHGNGVTARRWHGLLTGLGHRVVIERGPEIMGPCDLLIALHARKSGAAIYTCKRQWPGVKVVLAMTGTDLHIDLPDCEIARASVAAADRIVVLYDGAEHQLPVAARSKVEVILQSVPTPATPRVAPPATEVFQACVLAHLRDVKDPLCAARALARLPQSSPLRVVLAGEALDPTWERAARAAEARDSRFCWVGELAPAAVVELLARSMVLVISSVSEGGANVVSEAVVNGVPVLATAIAGNQGLLGDDYPGLFPVGDDAALATLLERCAADADFYRRLERWATHLRPHFNPAVERAAWAALLDDLSEQTRAHETPR